MYPFSDCAFHIYTPLAHRCILPGSYPFSIRQKLLGVFWVWLFHLAGLGVVQGQDYKLIAHRGGIVEGRYPENTPIAIEAAVQRGYFMLEVDIRESKDGKLVVHHDPNFYRFYGDERQVADLTWEEISKIRSLEGSERPIQFYELAALCKGKINLMMDTKGPEHGKAFYEEMERVLLENDLLQSAYFIGTQESRDFFKGKARISINYEGLQQAVIEGEAVSELYFLFEHGNVLDSEMLQLAERMNVPVVPSVNLFHYREEDPMEGAYQDIAWLQTQGVKEFQIDSEYDRWFFYSGNLSHTPVIGDLGTNRAKIWTRFTQPGLHVLRYMGPEGEEPLAQTATVSHDFCITWELSGLLPDTEYQFALDGDKKLYRFRTRPILDSTALLVFASCARDNTDIGFPIWTEIQEGKPDALVLLGDTPYIDSTHPQYQIRRYREFYDVPEFQDLLSTTPLYSIWDDHDYGKNDSGGMLEGRDNSRNAFMQFRPNPSFGEAGEGIYTHFSLGPAEVFLLDTRWFMNTGPSPIKKSKLTLLGEQQWEWLKKNLLASKAPIKILACGMIWNEATRPNKPDHWGAYPYEREALFKWIEKNNIEGVILVGGDIHRSRHVVHAPASKRGYPIHEFITSPMHGGIIEAANAPHPGLKFDMGIGESYLKLVVNDAPKAVLKANFMVYGQGSHYSVSLSKANLSFRR